MKKLLGIAAVAEAATGVALLIIPSLVCRLLFGTGLAGVSISMARVTGIALLSLGISCWPSWTALYGMLTYSALATLYLAYLGVAGEFSGMLLWPAVLLHAMLTVLLTRSWFSERGKIVTKPPS
jgi:hypothetical protein